MPDFNAVEVMSPEYYGLDDATRRATEGTNSKIDLMWWRHWRGNLEANVERAHRLPALSTIFGGWKGSGCIVCGAGPSIGEDMELVARAQDGGWKLIAVDRAFPVLKRAGLRPDITVSSDAGQSVAEFFPESLVEPEDTFALNVISHPDVFEKLAGAKVFVYSCANPFSGFWKYAAEKLPPEAACLRPGFVVTFSAVDLALWMGADPVLTIGNELSWRSEDEAGSDYRTGTDFIRLPGGRVTINSFLKASRAFRFFPMRYPEVSFIDCSNGIVAGWKKSPLKAAIGPVGMPGRGAGGMEFEAEGGSALKTG